VTRPPAAVLGPGTDPAENDHVLGDPDAPVTVLEYGDYECPYCAAAAPALLRLVAESDGQVRLVFRNFPIADRHPYALTAALAAEAAADQDAFWPMHEVLFARQDRLDDASLRSYAEELGLDADRVVGEPAQRFGDKVEADFAAGLAAGVAGTPTVFVDGRQFSGRVEFGALRRAVAAASSGAVADGGVAGGVADEPRVEPRPRRQHWWSRRLRGAEREALAQDAQQDDAEHRRHQ
jgi:protein-disulfide isomerase